MIRMLNPPLRRLGRAREAAPARASPAAWQTLRVACLAAIAALGLVLPAAARAIDRQATPGPEPHPLPEGVTVDRLIDARLGASDLLAAVDTVALARVTLSPGATATAANGAHLFVVEDGAMTVQAYARAYLPPTGTPGPVHEDVPAGPPITYVAGDQFLVSYDVASSPSIANEGSEPAVALVVSLAATGDAGIEDSLTGWSAVELLAVEDAADGGLDPELFAAIVVGDVRLPVALDRVRYDDGAGRGPGGELVDEAMIDLGEIVTESGARLLVVEAGALNYLVGDPALLRRPGEAPQQVPASSRISQVSGEQVLVRYPGRMLTRNVGRGPSTVLIVTVGPAMRACDPGPCR
jgi:hypothetical protein